MSTALRIIVLMIAAFGGVWIYKFRAPELDELVSRFRDQAPPPLLPEVSELVPNPLPVPLEDVSARAIFYGPAPMTPFDPASSVISTGGSDGSDSSIDDPRFAAMEDEVEMHERLRDRLPPDIDFDGGSSPPEKEDEDLDSEPADAPLTDGEVPLTGLTRVVYRVEEGDNLWKVAFKHLGDGMAYKKIIAENRELLGGGEQIRPGMELVILVPVREKQEKREDSWKKLKDGASSNDKSVKGRSSPDGERSRVRGVDPGTWVVHKVKKNENLVKIAARYFSGNSQGWRLLYDANRDRLSSPDHIREGQELRVPPTARAE